MAKDPVCGMEVNEKKVEATATHGGQDLLLLGQAPQAGL